MTLALQYMEDQKYIQDTEAWKEALTKSDKEWAKACQEVIDEVIIEALC